MYENLCAKLERCRCPANQAWSLPPQVYADPAVLSTEMERIFRRRWICLGRSDQLSGNGEYNCLDFSGQSIILLRDGEGTMRAFANTCRHRGSRLLEGSGRTAGIRCPFHGWAYKLDGRLAGAPRMEDAVAFSKAEFGLIGYQTAERMGFLFVCLAGEAPDLDAALGDFRAVHAPWPIADLVSRRYRRFEVGCNWKAFIEVFNDYYHLPFVHPDSIAAVYRRPDPADQVRGSFATQFGATGGTGGLLAAAQQKPLPAMPGLVGREAEGVRYTWFFPNMTFAAGVDALWMYEAYPLAPDRCLVHQTACFPPETVRRSDFDDRVAAYYHRLDAALDEDISALVNQQRGISNPDAEQGPFQPLLEPSVAKFADWYAGVMMGRTDKPCVGVQGQDP